MRKKNRHVKDPQSDQFEGKQFVATTFKYSFCIYSLSAAPGPHWSMPDEVFGWWPLAVAVARRSQSVLRLLLENGAFLSCLRG